MIRFDNVTKTYKAGSVAVRDVSIEIDKGEFVFLVGPSGSGKTTLIRLLLREELPDSGKIWVAGKDVGAMSSWRVPYLQAEHRLRVPGLPAPAQQDRVRERGLRSRGDRPAEARHHDSGSADPRSGRPRQKARPSPGRALRR